MHRRNSFVFVVLVCLVVTSISNAATRKLSFGTDGRVITPVSSDSDRGSLIIPVADGKLLVAGDATVAQTVDTDLYVSRYESNGSLDDTFGDEGFVKVPVGSYNARDVAMVVQSDGKILVGGGAVNENWEYVFIVVRLNSDGSFDSSFGTDGTVTVSFGWGGGSVMSLALQSDGKIVAGGWSYSGVTQTDFAMVRLLSDGTLDTTFGDGGKVSQPIGNGADVGAAVAVLPSGKILMTGWVGDNSAWNFGFAAARFNEDGSLDTSFGNSGKVNLLDETNYRIAYTATVLGNGKILLSGFSYTRDEYFPTLTLLNANGTIDTSFGDDGTVVAPVQGWGRSVALLSNGKILVGGSSPVRFNGDGTLDTTFGTDGIGEASEIIDRGIALLSSGKFILTGYLGEESSMDSALVGYLSNGSIDQ